MTGEGAVIDHGGDFGPDPLTVGDGAGSPARLERRRHRGPIFCGSGTVIFNGAFSGTPTFSGTPGPFCNTLLAICWWDFEAVAVSLPEGDATITAIGVDSLGRSDSAQVSGIVEVCVDGGSNGPASVGVGQSNRCHVIDGCSTSDIVAPDVQDPAAGTLGHSSTAFGKDTDVPPVPERFPHGAHPATTFRATSTTSATRRAAP